LPSKEILLFFFPKNKPLGIEMEMLLHAYSHSSIVLEKLFHLEDKITFLKQYQGAAFLPEELG
jgi:hypothetical protein